MSSLQQELERSFGEGPAQQPVEAILRSGRRALRRRRMTAGAGALAVVAALGTGYAVSAAGPEPRSSGVVATDPTSTPTASPTQDPQPADALWRHADTVRYVDGTLQIRPGVTVHEHIENPFGYRPPKLSDALDVTFRGQRSWVIAEFRPGDFGQAVGYSVPSNGWASFADYVADQVAANGGYDTAGNGWPDTLRLTDSGTVVASAGSEILQRTDDPQLGDSFAAPGTPTGAAVVTAAEDGVGYFVVWRVVDGQLDVITTPPRDVVGATFDELLTYARGQYASGEGLR